jgi:hypothetical protein
MSEFIEIHRETGIPCFECGERSGMDCPGRRPDEATRCTVCLEKFMKIEQQLQSSHDQRSKDRLG